MSELEITRRHPRALSPSGIRPPSAPDWIAEVDNPYLHGLFAPVDVESEAEELRVEGEIPSDLFGGYFRNGPNSRFAPSNRYHWFDGDGMVHAIWFRDGKATYKSRWVATKGHQMELDKGAAIWPGVLGPFDFSLPLAPLKDTGNTDLIYANGQLLALWYESGEIHAMDPFGLARSDRSPFGGVIDIPVSAHSKIDPSSGDFIFFGYGDQPPYLRYGVVTAAGKKHQVEVELPGPRRPHDIGVTANYSILHDFPVFFDPDLFKKTGKRIPLFHPEVPTRFGIIPRFGAGDQVRWFECAPCYMLHTVNCWEEGEWIVMVGCRTADPSLRPDKRDGKLAAMLSGLKLSANLYEWRMNMATGEVRERPLDDLNAEFPMINSAFTGIKSRYSYHQRIPYEIPATFDGIVKYDLQTGSAVRWEYGAGVYGSESPFAPRAPEDANAREDDGYLVTFVTDTHTWKSACLVFDATDIQSGPIATVHLPQRIPAGFHSTWVPGASLISHHPDGGAAWPRTGDGSPS